METTINLLLVFAFIWSFIVFNKQYKDPGEIVFIVIIDAILIISKLVLWIIS